LEDVIRPERSPAVSSTMKAYFKEATTRWAKVQSPGALSISVSFFDYLT
jgi:hypothetical protein